MNKADDDMALSSAEEWADFIYEAQNYTDAKLKGIAVDAFVKSLRAQLAAAEADLKDANHLISLWAKRISAAEAQLQAMRKALEEIAPAVKALACHQQQCDMDGVVVMVSRQAVDEVVNAINEMAIGPLRSLTEGAEKK